MTAHYTAKPMNAVDAAKIAERAYRLWESEGRPHGRAVDHWLQAEAELAIVPVPQGATTAAKSSTLRRSAQQNKAGIGAERAPPRIGSASSARFELG
jgi:hypothetical protein